MEIGADNISMAIDGREILRGVSLVCSSGQMTALIGPSGSGKTTLLHCLGLLQVPDGGRILADGKDTVGWKSSRRRKFWADHVAFILQDHGVMEEESVEFNVTMAMSVIGRRALGDRSRLESALEQTGLAGRGTELAAHLSGGEKQRLGVARAIYKNADVILADEPTASLDDRNRTGIMDLLSSQADSGRTVIIATHDEKLMAVCGQQYTVAGRRSDSIVSMM